MLIDTRGTAIASFKIVMKVELFGKILVAAEPGLARLCNCLVVMTVDSRLIWP